MNLEELLKIVVCPQCRHDLRLAQTDGAEGLECDHCQIVYPIRDEIPILLVEEAIPRQDWPEQATKDTKCGC